jgi:valyl-tRNA synthetase
MSDDYNNMTAEELYNLAKQREIEEQKKVVQENQEKIAELREERRQLQLKHNKEIREEIRQLKNKHKDELKDVNAKIKALGGRVSGASAGGKGRTGASAAIVDILEAGEMDTTVIREKLEAIGISVGNLGQTLAYLKRNGRVASVARGIYKKA